MKKYLLNFIFLIAGILMLTIELQLLFDGILGFTLATAGVFFILIGIFWKRSVLKAIAEIFDFFI